MKGWVIKHLECVIACEPHNIYESLWKEMDKVKDVFPGLGLLPRNFAWRNKALRNVDWQTRKLMAQFKFSYKIIL